MKSWQVQNLHFWQSKLWKHFISQIQIQLSPKNYQFQNHHIRLTLAQSVHFHCFSVVTYVKRAIQIIRDTLNRFDNVSHIFHCYQNVGSEKFCLTERLSFKRYFLFYSFCTLKQIRLKIGDQKRETVTKGGGGGSK